MFLYWLFFTPSAMEPAMTEKFAQIPPNPTAYAWGSFDRMMQALAARLSSHDWIGWDRFTVADIMIAGGGDELLAADVVISKGQGNTIGSIEVLAYGTAVYLSPASTAGHP